MAFSYVFEQFRAKVFKLCEDEFDDMWSNMDISYSLKMLQKLQERAAAGKSNAVSWRPYNFTVAEQTRHWRIKVLKIKLDLLDKRLVPQNEQIRVRKWYLHYI